MLLTTKEARIYWKHSKGFTRNLFDQCKTENINQIWSTTLEEVDGEKKYTYHTGEVVYIGDKSVGIKIKNKLHCIEYEKIVYVHPLPNLWIVE